MQKAAFFFFSAIALSLPLAAHADADAQRDTVRSTRGRYGHAETLVDASPERVKQVMLDFAHYKELHPKFRSARVIARQGDTTDLYMRLPVRVGPVTIPQSEVMRFGPARATAGGGWTLEGRGVKGDMKEGHVVMHVVPVDAAHSLLTIDLLLAPNLPAPQSMIDEELRDGAFDLANGMRDRARAG